MKFFQHILILYFGLFSLKLEAQVTQGLILHYDFNNGSTADVIGTNHATNSGATPCSDRFGNPNNAYYFSNSGIGTDPFSIGNQTSASISVWLKADASAITGGTSTPIHLGYWAIFINRYNSVGRLLGVMDGSSLNNSTNHESRPIDTNWTHIALTNDGVTTKLYINGVLDKSYPETFSWVDGNYLHLGRQFENNTFKNHYSGKMDDFKIYGRALNDAEVQLLHNNNPNTFNCNIPINSSNLDACFPFSGNPNDQSGNDNHGTVIGAQLTTDRFGNPDASYFFDGIDDYIEVPHDPILNFDVNEDFSISCWIKPEAIQNANYQSGDVISKWEDYPGSGTNDDYPYAIRFMSQTNTNHGKVFFARYDRACQNFPAIYSTNSYLNEDFLHVVTVKEGSILKLFINGVLAQVEVDSTTCSTMNAQNFFIGRRGGSQNASFFKGKIDDILIFSRPLTNAEVVSLFEAPNPTGGNCHIATNSMNLDICLPFSGNSDDESGNDNHGKVEGALLTSDRFGNPNSAYYFDGVDDYIEIQTISDLDSVGDFSLSLWFYQEQWELQPGVSATNLDRQYIFDAHSYSSTTTNYLYTDGPLVNTHYTHANSTFIRNNTFISAGEHYPYDLLIDDPKILNNWHHCVFIRRGNVSEHYLDGALIGTRNVTTQLLDIAHNMFIGTFSGNNPTAGATNFNFHGKIDDFLLYSRAITPSEVNSLYQTSTCTPKTNINSIVICPTQTIVTPKGEITSVPGIYSDTLTTKLGCDSLVSLEVKYSESLLQCDSVIGNSGIFGPRLIVYPNPTSDYFKVEVFGLTEYNISVYDQRGRIVFIQKNVSQSLSEFFLGRLAAGVYTISISSENFVVSEKLVIY